MALGDMSIGQSFDRNQVVSAQATNSSLPAKLADSGTEFKIRFKNSNWGGTLSNTSGDVIGGSTYPVDGLVVPEFTVVLESPFAVVKHADITIGMDATGFTDARYWFIQWVNPNVGSPVIIVIGDMGSDQSIVTAPLEINFENNNGGELFKFG